MLLTSSASEFILAHAWPPLAVLPFVLLLLAIAVLPLFAEKWWHSNLRKALVAVGLGLPVVGYICYLMWNGQPQGRANTATSVRAARWVLKQVQHDEGGGE